MNKVSIYKLDYPLFRVSFQEYQLLRDVLFMYDKGDVYTDCLCFILSDLWDREPTYRSLSAKISKKLHPHMTLRGYLRVSPLSSWQSRVYLRHIWVRKLLNYNRKYFQKVKS